MTPSFPVVLTASLSLVAQENNEQYLEFNVFVVL